MRRVGEEEWRDGSVYVRGRDRLFFPPPFLFFSVKAGDGLFLPASLGPGRPELAVVLNSEHSKQRSESEARAALHLV